MTKILDCTLRDGGYYTNWDFDWRLVEKYIETVNDLPIDYVEIGYRNSTKKEYMGEYFYTPIGTIDRIRRRLIPNVKIAIMINTKDIESIESLEYLLNDCSGKVDLIRFACSSTNLQNAVLYAKKVKQLGYEVALNLMYLSRLNTENLITQINYICENVENLDYLYLVDSYGSCMPSEVKEKFEAIKAKYNKLVFGFHGHDNIQLAYANSLEAINAGATIVDATITGMGRGAGNLSTEIICSYVAVDKHIELNYSNLVELVEKFNVLKAEYGWGTSIPYMISGFNKLPQGEVMNLISLKRYSTSNIVKIIENKIHSETQKHKSNGVQHLVNSKNEYQNYDFSVLVGGGTSVETHIEGLRTLNEKYKVLFIHSTTKHMNLFSDNGFNNNLICLPGDEVNKVKNVMNKSMKFVISIASLNNVEILNNNNIYSIEKTSLNESDNKVLTEDAPLFMCLNVTETLDIHNFYLIGFDGYDIETKTNTILREENQTIIDYYSSNHNKLISLTPSKYNIDVNSLYSIIVHGAN